MLKETWKPFTSVLNMETEAQENTEACPGSLKPLTQNQKLCSVCLSLEYPFQCILFLRIGEKSL